MSKSVFNFKLILDGKTEYFVKSHLEVSKFFKYMSDELIYNGYDLGYDKIEVIRGAWSIDEIKSELNVGELYVATKNGDAIMATEYEAGKSVDAHLIFADEEFADNYKY